MSEENKTTEVVENGVLKEVSVSNEKVISLLTDIRDKSEKELDYIKTQTKIAIATSVLSLLIVICLAVSVIALVPKVVKVLNEANGLIGQANQIMTDVSGVVTEVDGIVGDVNTKLSDVYGMIDDVNVMLGDVNGIIGKVDGIVGDVDGIVGKVDSIIGDVNGIIAQTSTVIGNLQTMSDELINADIPGMLKNLNSLVTTTESSLTEAVDKITSIDIDSLNDAIKDLSNIIAPLSKLLGGRAK